MSCPDCAGGEICERHRPTRAELEVLAEFLREEEDWQLEAWLRESDGF